MTPGAEKVVSLATALVSVRTKVSGWTVGTGSVSCWSWPPGPRERLGLSTIGTSSDPIEQLLPSSGLISWNFTGCVQLRRAKFEIWPAS